MDFQKGSCDKDSYESLSSFLASAPTNADEVKMDLQKGYGDKDTSETFYGENPPISVAASKPLSSNMDSRYFL